MTKMTLGTHPYLLGFDQLERLAERAAKGADAYPPYNIEQSGADGFRITLAVAGFAEADLSQEMTGYHNRLAHFWNEALQALFRIILRPRGGQGRRWITDSLVATLGTRPVDGIK